MIKNFKKFNEERKYDFSHPDAPDTWSVHVPDDRPQQYDKVTCINNDKFEGKLTVDKPYQILGFSSMGDMYFMEDDTKRYNRNIDTFNGYKPKHTVPRQVFFRSKF